MPKEEPTQHTRKGLEIPVPTRRQVDDALAAVAMPIVEHSDKSAPREAHVPPIGPRKLRKALSRGRKRSPKK
jgi:hypothetical protein